MEATQPESGKRTSRKTSSRLSRTLYATAVLLLWTGVGCSPIEEEPGPSDLGTTAQEMVTLNGLAFNGLAFNGLAFNGLAFNGLAFNGLAFNGLAFNGLAFNGLSNAAFTAWFDSDPAMADMLMKYIVAVRRPAPGRPARTHTGVRPTRGTVGWGWHRTGPAARRPPRREQQLISACLAAHGNKYGKRVPISVLGENAQGAAHPLPPPGARRLLRSGRPASSATSSTARASTSAMTGACSTSGRAPHAPVPSPPASRTRATRARRSPRRELPESLQKDPTKTCYATCSYNGITYQPITTRMRTQEIYKCGDGICQFTESCGRGRTHRQLPAGLRPLRLSPGSWNGERALASAPLPGPCLPRVTGRAGGCRRRRCTSRRWPW